MQSIDYMPLLKKHLSSQGTTYEKHYCTVSICCPSRVNIWTGLADADAAEETLQLSNAKSIQDAVDLLVKTLGMQPLEGTEMALSGSTHSLRLYGKSVGGGKVVGQVRMAYSARSGVTVKISVRSEEDGLAALVVGGVA